MISLRIFIYMAARTLQSAQHLGNGLDNQGSWFNAWQGQELFQWVSGISPPPNSRTIPQPTSRLHGMQPQLQSILTVDIILLFQNLSLEIGLQPTHKSVHSSLQNATYIQVSAQYHKHTVSGQLVHRTMQ